MAVVRRSITISARQNCSNGNQVRIDTFEAALSRSIQPNKCCEYSPHGYSVEAGRRCKPWLTVGFLLATRIIALSVDFDSSDLSRAEYIDHIRYSPALTVNKEEDVCSLSTSGLEDEKQASVRHLQPNREKTITEFAPILLFFVVGDRICSVSHIFFPQSFCLFLFSCMLVLPLFSFPH